jgi:RNA polymerase sigma factor (sigma-70 family)
MVTEPEAFAAMFDAHYLDLLRYVQRRSAPEAVDDIVAETFEVAWRRRSDLPADLRPWLFTTASNLMSNGERARARRRQLAIRSYLPQDLGRDVDADLDFVAAWRRLSARDQEVLALRAWDGLTDTEAAQVLGCTRASFTMRFGRARRRLAAHMAIADAAPIRSLTPRPKEGAS